MVYRTHRIKIQGQTYSDSARKLDLTEPLAVNGKPRTLEKLIATFVPGYDGSDTWHSNALVVRHHPGVAGPGFPSFLKPMNSPEMCGSSAEHHSPEYQSVPTVVWDKTVSMAVESGTLIRGCKQRTKQTHNRHMRSPKASVVSHPGAGDYSVQPWRYSLWIICCACGEFETRRFFASHLSISPLRYATTPSSTASVSAPE